MIAHQLSTFEHNIVCRHQQHTSPSPPSSAWSHGRTYKHEEGQSALRAWTPIMIESPSPSKHYYKNTPKKDNRERSSESKIEREKESQYKNAPHCKYWPILLFLAKYISFRGCVSDYFKSKVSLPTSIISYLCFLFFYSKPWHSRNTISSEICAYLLFLYSLRYFL